MAKKIERYLNSISELIEFIKDEDYVFIQPHNFPDHDAVASAFGLQQLFKYYEIKSYLVYEGNIQRDSLKHFIADLDIKIKHINEYPMIETDKIINIDGCKGNKNVTDLIGDEIGVIDHHLASSPDDVEFSDIRTDYGACSTIIAEYYKELEVHIPRDVATALMIGINVDTSSLTRGVSIEDLEAYFNCFAIANQDYVVSILRNYIRIDDLVYYRYLLDHVEYYDRFGYCYFPDGCSQNLLGILADFILALDEIDFVVLCAKNGNNINFSIRNEASQWNASNAIRQTLKGIGFGGGHEVMAGGVIRDASKFDQEFIKKSIIKYLIDNDSC